MPPPSTIRSLAWLAETLPLVHAILPYVLSGGVMILGLYLRMRPVQVRLN